MAIGRILRVLTVTGIAAGYGLVGPALAPFLADSQPAPCPQCAPGNPVTPGNSGNSDQGIPLRIPGRSTVTPEPIPPSSGPAAAGTPVPPSSGPAVAGTPATSLPVRPTPAAGIEGLAGLLGLGPLLGTGSAAVGSAAVGSAGLGVGALAGTGSAAVGTTAGVGVTGSAAVGSAGATTGFALAGTGSALAGTGTAAGALLATIL